MTPAVRPGSDVIEVYARGVEFSFSKFRTSPAGLTSAEANARREQSGKRNELAQEPEESLVVQYLKKFTDPMVVLLLISATISIIMRQVEDACSIVLAVIIVSTVGFVQEYKSEKAVDALKELVAHRCIALRDGKPVDMLAADLVEGDVVQLAPGMRVPADLRLFEASSLAVNESLLTGEPEAAAKSTDPLPETGGVNLAERSNMVFAGTSVAAGTGAGIVTAIGDDTELGKISEMLQEKDRKTPLQLSMDDFGKRLSLFSMVVIVAISVVGFLQGKPALSMFNMAVSLIVAAIPEGLPIAVTVTLALGVTRMSSRNAIVRKLPAVEALGATNVICVDKTGTLTQNQMTVTAIYTARPINVVHEKESLTEGGVTMTVDDGTNEKITPQTDRHLAELLRAAVLCNNAQIDSSSVVGQPTEGGLLSVAHKAGIPDFRKTLRRIREIPFSSQTKWMAVQVESEPAPRFYVKGGVEVVLPRCTDAYSGALNRDAIDTEYRRLASRSLRVIAVAFGDSPEGGLVFLGLLGLRDPPRHGVREAVQICKDSHVRVVMITGDSKETAIAIARELGIAQSEDEALSAAEIDSLPLAEVDERVRRANVFYRMTPAHKVKVVNAHSARGGSIVAMTGDGVNDAPALSHADIGIAMGRGGSDVCKEASELILVDNNFSTIVAAIEEGKVIFENIKNFLHFQLTTSIAAMLLTAVCSIADLPLPLNPTQILLINIIMDGPPAQSLTFESYRDRSHRQPPRDPRASIVDARMAAKIAVSAITMVIGTISVFLWAIPSDNLTFEALTEMNEPPRYASTMAFTTFVLFQLFNAFNCRSATKSVFTIGLFSNRGINWCFLGSIAAQLLVIYTGPLNLIFRTTPVPPSSLLLCFLVASSVWIIDELWKFLSHYK